MICKCGSYAINHGSHGRDGSDPDLCDVCYWRKRAGDSERYKAALHEVVFACRTKISMKQKAREALFNEKTAHIPD